MGFRVGRVSGLIIENGHLRDLRVPSRCEASRLGGFGFFGVPGLVFRFAGFCGGHARHGGIHSLNRVGLRRSDGRFSALTCVW